MVATDAVELVIFQLHFIPVLKILCSRYKTIYDIVEI